MLRGQGYRSSGSAWTETASVWTRIAYGLWGTSVRRMDTRRPCGVERRSRTASSERPVTLTNPTPSRAISRPVFVLRTHSTVPITSCQGASRVSENNRELGIGGPFRQVEPVLSALLLRLLPPMLLQVPTRAACRMAWEPLEARVVARKTHPKGGLYGALLSEREVTIRLPRRSMA